MTTREMAMEINPLFQTEESEDLTRLRRLDRGLANAFPEDMGRIPNNPVIAAVMAALFKGGERARHLQGGWLVDPSGRLVYRHIGKTKGQVVIYLDLPPGRNGLDEQWALVERFSPLTIDTLIVLLAQLCEPSALNKTRGPEMQTITVPSSAIMRYKKMTRWGAERSAFRDKLAMEMDAICRIRFDVLNFPAFDPEQGRWAAEGVSIFGDRVLDIARTVAVHPDKNNKSFVDHYWHVRFGQWGMNWMNAQGKVWLGPIPKPIVEFDHRKNRGADVLAKKLGVSTLLLWGAVRSRHHIERRIDNLLESVGELPEVPERSSHWAGRMFDRMVDASLMLEELDLLQLTYDGGECVPTQLERNKGWVKDWLGSKLQVERPDYLNGA
ncbi:MAG: hypothetical protein EP340_07305 [Alphaproteobacteria bacterium]|nr:MAG: hypothetical protein EP340_07305 [Alphaproteobacteria bacterium]